MSQTEIVEIPLAEVGLDPLFQVRAIDPEEVQRLVESWTPERCEPLWVRPWPQSDTRPRPVGCEHAAYQVASGWTRTTAARELGLTTLPAIVRELNDLDFRAWAVEGNAFHGKRMTDEEKRVQVEKLAKGRMSQRDIAKKTGIHQSTVSRMLSGRDSNLSRKVMRTHQPSEEKGAGAYAPDLPKEWQAAPVSPDAQRMRQVARTVHDFLAGTPSDLAPGDVVAWVATLPPLTRRSMVADLDATMRWLGYFRTALDLPKAAQEEGAA